MSTGGPGGNSRKKNCNYVTWSHSRLAVSARHLAARVEAWDAAMFNLAILKDTVAVHPSDFGGPQEQAIIAELNKKYANRILHDVGLCICVFDITEAGEGKVRYGDGFLWYKGVLDFNKLTLALPDLSSHFPNGHLPAIPVRGVTRKSHVLRPQRHTMCVRRLRLALFVPYAPRTVSVDFFDDIYIPVHYLPQPTALSVPACLHCGS
jgi:DNA-directed RNA polymerase III subunit RPC8